MQQQGLVKLAFGEILIQAIKLPVTHGLTCIKLALPLIVSLLVVIFGFFSLTDFSQISEPSREPFAFAASLLSAFFIFCCFVMMIVGWHQVFILKGASPKIWRWEAEERRFFVYSIAICLLFVLIFTPGLLFLLPLFFTDSQGMVSDAFAFAVIGLVGLGFVLFMFLLPRVLLVLPATAVSNNVGIGGAWRLTKGNTLALFALLILIPGIANAILESFAGLAGFIALLTIPVTFYLYAVEVALLSLCYKAITSEVNQKKPIDEQ